MVLMTPDLKKLPGTLHVPQATQCTLTERPVLYSSRLQSTLRENHAISLPYLCLSKFGKLHITSTRIHFLEREQADNSRRTAKYQNRKHT